MNVHTIKTKVSRNTIVQIGHDVSGNLKYSFGRALVIPSSEMGEQVRSSCNKACIFPNSADFKDRIFELPIRFCSLHELVGK